MKICPITVAAFSILAVVPRAHTEIPWLKDLALAKQESAQQNKPLLIAFSGEWAPPAVELMKLLETNFESQIKTGYIPVLMDSHQGESEKPEHKFTDNLMYTMKVDLLPTLIIAEADGTEISRLVGGRIEKLLPGWLANKGDPKKLVQAQLAEADAASGIDKQYQLRQIAEAILARRHVENPLADLFPDLAARSDFAEKIFSKDESVRAPALALEAKLLKEFQQGSAEGAWQLAQAYSAQADRVREDDEAYLEAGVGKKAIRQHLIQVLADRGYSQAITEWVQDRAVDVSLSGEFDNYGLDESRCREWADAGVPDAKYLLGIYYKNKDPIRSEKFFREVIATVAPSSPPAAPSTAEALTLDELVTLLQAGSTSEELLTEVTKRGYSGATDVSALTELKTAGATTALLLAIKRTAK